MTVRRGVVRVALGVVVVGATWLAGVLLWPIQLTLPRIEPRASTEYWAMQGGYRIAYTRVAAAEATSAPVIYLHGGPGGYVHSSQIEHLGQLAADGRDVYLYDQSGTGLSDRRERPRDTTLESHLSDLHEIVVDHLGVERVVLVGQSFGGFQAALFASRHPELVEALVLTSPAEIHPAHFDEEGRWVNLERYPPPAELERIDVADTYAEDTSVMRLPLRAIGAIVAAQLANVKLIPDAELDGALNTMASGFTRNMVCDPANVEPEEGGAGAYMRTGTNFFDDDYEDPRPAMRQVAAPVLVLQGQCDFVPYEAAYEYVDVFPHGTYEPVRGAGHVIPWEQPERFVDAIRTFLGTVSEP